MNLLMISTDRKIFEENSNVLSRIKDLAKSYTNLYVIVFSRRSILLKEKVSENINIYPTNSINSIFYIFDAIKIVSKIFAKYIKSDETNITCQDPFETGVVGFYIKRKFKIPLELQIHTDLYSKYFFKGGFLNRIRLFIAKITIPRADKIRVVSKIIFDSLVKRGIKKDFMYIKPIEVKNNFVFDQDNLFILKNKYSNFDKRILSVSRLEREKNIPLALKSFKKVLEKLPNICLIIVGDGSERKKIEKLSVELSLIKNIFFVGWQKDVFSYYKIADVFINTSWYEGYGMSIMEAKNAGCKVVSTDVGIAREEDAVIADFNEFDFSEKIFKVISKQ